MDGGSVGVLGASAGRGPRPPLVCRREGRVHFEVRALDLVAESIPTGPWDVIHERLVLQHIPERLDVLSRLVDALAPGGVLLLEDFDTGVVRTVDRSGPDHELIEWVAHAFNRLLGTRGGISDFVVDALRILWGHGLEGTGASGVHVDRPRRHGLGQGAGGQRPPGA